MKNLAYDENGLLIVNESHCCEHFEPDNGALVPMRECWCCKWSNFRKAGETDNLGGYSICNYVGNKKEEAVLK
ncbi:hypothetical protein [Butyrivibrio proteoclasticus]|uniref:hypothetical protein n=1 Tax=Butyrivibrio proteoclasticus TaxID=43305 RepID=UPI00047A21D9|nr:hypothetical protein [Butyrivibrio proteoclasticus]